MNWRHSFAQKREVHKNGENFLVWLVVAIRLCVPIQLSLPGRMEIMQVQVPSVQSGTREVLAQRTPDYFVQKEPNEPIQQPSVEQTQAVSEEKTDMFDFLLAYPYVLWLGRDGNIMISGEC